MPSAFVSYSWENNDHKEWVKALGARLRGDGVDVTLDQWHLVPGDQLPKFMESSIRENDFVLIVCTPHYKRRSDAREGGVGYEGDIITAEVFVTGNQRKFIPLLRAGEWSNAAPTWIQGKFYLDFRGTPYSETCYEDLLATLTNRRPSAPTVGTLLIRQPQRKPPETQTNTNAGQPSYDDIRIEGILVDQVTVPKMDGTRGSALYAIPFRLSRMPSSAWANAFVRAWDHPPRYTTMHRPGIARVRSDTVILDGTTIEEVRMYHRETLMLAVAEANKEEKEALRQRQIRDDQERARVHKHREDVMKAAKRIKF